MQSLWYITIVLTDILAFVLKPFFLKTTPNVNIVIDSGRGGWRLLEYQFLYSSLEEIEGLVLAKTTYSRTTAYWRHIWAVLKIHKPQQIFIDPRTFAEQSRYNWWVSTVIACSLLKAARVRVVGWMTDYPQRRWRFVVFAFTRHDGVVAGLMAPTVMSKGVYHGRIVGPMPIPVPQKILSMATNIISCRHEVGFVGALYEPRTSKLLRISKRLQAVGVNFHLASRSLTAERMTDEEYLESLRSCKIIITTSDQVFDSESDSIDRPHLIFRYLEVLSCARVLVAPIVEGADFFAPYIHYIPYLDEEQVVSDICDLLARPEKLESMAKAGYLRTCELNESKYFWGTLGVVNQND